MAASGTLAIRILGDIADFQGKMGTAQKALIGIGAAVGTAGIAALRMGDDYDEAADSIRTATGKTGAALAGLETSFKNVAGRVKEDIGLTSAVLGELHSRTGLTGQALEDMTVRVIEFSRVTGTDAVANTALVTRLFGDWSIATEDQAEVMDKLLRASQETGLGVDALMQTVVQFGAPLRTLGFSMEESIALLGKWEEEGVNVEAMLAGMKVGLGNLAASGVPANEMAATFRARLEAIRTSSTPAADAIALFGKRAGPDLAAGILEGRFSVDDLLETIQNGSDTVRDAADDTRDFGDGFAELKNKITTAMGPIMADFAGLADAMGPAIYLLPALGGAIGGVTAKLWLKVAALAAASGGWKAMLLSMAPAAAVAGAVAGGLILVNEGLNKSDEAIRKSIDAWRLMNTEQRATIENTEVLGVKVPTIAEHFANFVGFVAPWHELADTTREFADGFDDLAGSYEDFGQRANMAVAAHGDEVHRVAMGVDDDIGIMDAAWQGLPQAVGDAGAESVEVLRARMIELHQTAAWAGATTPGQFSQGLRSSFDNIRTAFTDLKDLMRNTLSPAKEEAYLEGVATSRRLARGLNDERPAVRSEAQQIALDTIAQLHRLAPGSEEIGTLSMKLLAGAAEAEKPAIRDAIEAIVGVVDNTMDGIPPSATRTASSFVDKFTAAIRAGRKDVEAAVEYSFGRTMRGQSPPPEGPLHDIDKGGWNAADAWVKAFRNRIDTADITGSLQRIGAQAAAAMGQPGTPLTLAGAGAVGAGAVGAGYAPPAASGSPETHYHVHVEGLVEAKTPDDIGRVLRRVGSLGLSPSPGYDK